MEPKKKARWNILIETTSSLLEGNRNAILQPLTVYLPCHYMPQQHFDCVRKAFVYFYAREARRERSRERCRERLQACRERYHVRSLRRRTLCFENDQRVVENGKGFPS